MDDKRDYDARPDMFYQLSILDDIEKEIEALHKEFDRFLGKRRDSMSPKVNTACDEVFVRIDKAEESLDDIHQSMGAVIDIFDDAEYCDSCGDYHNIGSIPLSCKSGDGS